MNAIPENVTVAFRFASALWPHDPAALSEATALVWAATLAEYSADELCRVLELQAKQQDWMPPLATLVADLRSTRRRDERGDQPLLTPPAPVQLFAKKHSDITGPDTVYRAKLRKDAITYWRTYRGHVSQEKLAEIDAWVDEVGPFEQAFLAQHGIHVEVTQPQRTVGNAVTEADPEPVGKGGGI